MSCASAGKNQHDGAAHDNDEKEVDAELAEKMRSVFISYPNTLRRTIRMLLHRLASLTAPHSIPIRTASTHRTSSSITGRSAPLGSHGEFDCFTEFMLWTDFILNG